MKRVKCRMLKMSYDIFKEQKIVIKFLVKLGTKKLRKYLRCYQLTLLSRVI